VILALQGSAPARSALRRGGTGLRVVTCRTGSQVLAALRKELVDGVVIDLRAGGRDLASYLARWFPGIPVFGFSRFTPDDGPLLAECRALGVRAVLVEGVDDGIAAEFIAARSATARWRAALAIGPRVLRLSDAIQLRAWEEVLRRASRPTTTAEIASALGSTREHLSREFAAGGAPNLKRVIDLARTAWAADLLGNPGYPVGVVARVLGYASQSHLALAAQRIAGAAPGELGALGPRGVLERFRRGRTRSRL
jgi:AraC-like DNA-binding protein